MANTRAERDLLYSKESGNYVTMTREKYEAIAKVVHDQQAELKIRRVGTVALPGGRHVRIDSLVGFYLKHEDLERLG